MAKVTYHVLPTQPSSINKIDYVIDDSLMNAISCATETNSPSREGDIYNA